MTPSANCQLAARAFRPKQRAVHSTLTGPNCNCLLRGCCTSLTHRFSQTVHQEEPKMIEVA